jgi:hypothetical protein
MADSKISALPSSTTPLAGTEVLPVVQGGQTQQVSVANLTAGRAVSALSMTLTNALGVASGGTGLSSATTGDLIYASATNTWANLADVATGNALISGGVGVAPSWGKIGLTTHVSGTLGVGNGGTGLTTYTAGDTLYYASGTTLSKLGIGASGYFMSSSGTAPQWSAPAALTAANDTNVTLTVGGSASTALLNAASVTAGWTGQLSIARGGTNATATPTAGGVSYGTGTAYAFTSAGTSGQALLSGGAGAPSFGTLGTGGGGTGLTSFTSTGILYASSTSALTTSSNFKYDGTNVTLTGGNIVQGTSGKGFNFTANTPASGMTTQVLSWYEEGTWTPTLNFGGATTGITYTTQAALYVRNGHTVFVSGYILLSSKGSATGAATISGLPFAVANSNGAYSAGNIRVNGMSFSTIPIIRVGPNATSINIEQVNTSGTVSNITDVNWGNTTSAFISLTYVCA